MTTRRHRSRNSSPPASDKLHGPSAETVKSTLHSFSNPLTVLWDDLLPWQRDNHYIHSGYRPVTYSFQGCYNTLWYLHNESVNIYSHLGGAAVVGLIGGALYRSLPSRHDTATSEDLLVIGLFFLSAVICMGMSATFHTTLNHSHSIARFGNKLDYIGIVLLIMGSYVPAIYYGLSCHRQLRNICWGMMFIIGSACLAVSIFDRFRTPAWRPYRAAMFIADGCVGVIPILHGMNIYGFRNLQARIGLLYIMLEGFLYILGACLYAARWPERSSPGGYDIWGNSHQIFHFLVVLAVLSHAYAMLKAFDYHHTTAAWKC